MPNNINYMSSEGREKGSKEYWEFLYLEESKERHRLKHILYHIELHVNHCISDKPITRKELWDLYQRNKNFWQGILNENNKLRKHNQVLRARLNALQEKREVHKLVKEENQ